MLLPWKALPFRPHSMLNWLAKSISTTQFMFLIKNLPGLLWAGFIFFLSVIPRNQVPQPGFLFEGADKLVHFFLYSVLSALLTFGFQRQTRFAPLRQSPIWWAVSLAIVYGIFLEFLQGTVFVSRSAEVLDMLANTAGSFVGVLFFRLIYGKLNT